MKRRLSPDAAAAFADAFEHYAITRKRRAEQRDAKGTEKGRT